MGAGRWAIDNWIARNMEGPMKPRAER